MRDLYETPPPETICTQQTTSISTNCAHSKQPMASQGVLCCTTSKVVHETLSNPSFKQATIQTTYFLKVVTALCQKHPSSIPRAFDLDIIQMELGRVDGMLIKIDGWGSSSTQPTRYVLGSDYEGRGRIASFLEIFGVNFYIMTKWEGTGMKVMIDCAGGEGMHEPLVLELLSRMEQDGMDGDKHRTEGRQRVSIFQLPAQERQMVEYQGSRSMVPPPEWQQESMGDRDQMTVWSPPTLQRTGLVGSRGRTSPPHLSQRAEDLLMNAFRSTRAAPGKCQRLLEELPPSALQEEEVDGEDIPMYARVLPKKARFAAPLQSLRGPADIPNRRRQPWERRESSGTPPPKVLHLNNTLPNRMEGLFKNHISPEEARYILCPLRAENVLRHAISRDQIRAIRARGQGPSGWRARDSLPPYEPREAEQSLRTFVQERQEQFQLERRAAAFSGRSDRANGDSVMSTNAQRPQLPTTSQIIPPRTAEDTTEYGPPTKRPITTPTPSGPARKRHTLDSLTADLPSESSSVSQSLIPWHLRPAGPVSRNTTPPVLVERQRSSIPISFPPLTCRASFTGPQAVEALRNSERAPRLQSIHFTDDVSDNEEPLRPSRRYPLPPSSGPWSPTRPTQSFDFTDDGEDEEEPFRPMRQYPPPLSPLLQPSFFTLLVAPSDLLPFF